MDQTAGTVLRFEGRVEELKGQRIIRLPPEISRALSSRGMGMGRVGLPAGERLLPLEPDGRGGHWLLLNDAEDVRPGQVIQMRLEPLTDWPEPAMPDDIMRGIASEGLLPVWQSLTTRARWEWLRWIRSTLNPATRERRIRVACSKLSQGDRRPCCFNTAGCTVPELCKSGQLLEG